MKKISKYPCSQEIKDAYTKYLTNYSFKEFVKYCEENTGNDLEDLIFKFTDLQLEKFEPNSLIWVSHVMINFMIYFDVNLDYGEYYDAYASALQLTVLSCAMEMSIKKIPFDEVSFPQNSAIVLINCLMHALILPIILKRIVIWLTIHSIRILILHMMNSTLKLKSI